MTGVRSDVRRILAWLMMFVVPLHAQAALAATHCVQPSPRVFAHHVHVQPTAFTRAQTAPVPAGDPTHAVHGAVATPDAGAPASGDAGGELASVTCAACAACTLSSAIPSVALSIGSPSLALAPPVSVAAVRMGVTRAPPHPPPRLPLA